jgi:hypothetical protein
MAWEYLPDKMEAKQKGICNHINRTGKFQTKDTVNGTKIRPSVALE